MPEDRDMEADEEDDVGGDLGGGPLTASHFLRCESARVTDVVVAVAVGGVLLLYDDYYVA